MRGTIGRLLASCACVTAAAAAQAQMAQSVEAHEVERLERDLIPRQRLEDRRNGGQRSLLFFVDGSGKRIGFGLAGRKYAVDDQVLL